MKARYALLSFTLLATSAGSAPLVGRLERSADLPGPRAGHTATRLADGNVLLTGGCTAEGCEDGISGDAALFDTARLRFVSAGRLQQARVNHRAVPLKDGSVLLIGGWTPGGASASVERYMPASRTFSGHGHLLQGRDAHTATALRDGTILIAGGYDSNMVRLAGAEIYDPRTRKSQAIAPMSSPRKSHTATLLPDGRVLIAGGSDTRDSVTASLEVYDPATRSFRAAGTLRKARHKHAAILQGDSVLLLGGAGIPESAGHFADSERWNLRTGRVVAGPVMAEGRYKFLDSVVALAGGSILVTGSGRNAEILDKDGARFRPIAGPIGSKLAFTTATALADGSVLVAGGYDPRIAPSARSWIYRPSDPSAP